MRDVEQQHVDLLRHERFGALEVVSGRADRRAHAQAAARVLGRVRLLLVELQVAHGDEPVQPAALVHERQLLDAVLEHRALGLLERDRGRPRHQPRARRHELGDRPRVGRGVERHVAVREQAGERLAALDLLDQEAAGVVAPDLGAPPDRGGAHEPERVLDHVRVARLDVAHARGLVGDRGIPVQEAEPALERERLGHLLADDGVHVGAQDRQRQLRPARERHREVHPAPRRDGAVLRPEQEVVEGPADEHGLELGHRTIVHARAGAPAVVGTSGSRA